MKTCGSTRFMDFLLHCRDNWIENTSLSMRNKSNFDNGIYCTFLNMASEQEMDGKSPGECFISHDRQMACYICEVLLKLTSSMQDFKECPPLESSPSRQTEVRNIRKGQEEQCTIGEGNEICLACASDVCDKLRFSGGKIAFLSRQRYIF